MLKVGNTYKFTVNEELDGQGGFLGYLGSNNEVLLFSIPPAEDHYGFSFDTMLIRFDHFGEALKLMTGELYPFYHYAKFFTCELEDVYCICIKDKCLNDLEFLYE